MIAKIHKNPQGQVILAICDNNLLGKKFTQGDLQIDLTGDFYKGEEKSEQEILNLVKGAYILNMVGEECINFALKHKLIEKPNIITVDGIPHAQCLIVRE